jgi:hypothetical protein
MSLTSTQIGALAENLIANELMIESEGRLSPFQPIADDDGIDVLIYDKKTGKALPIQVKSRTSAIKKRGSEERGNTVHFEVRKATLKADRHAYLLCVLLSENMRKTERAWLLPLSDLPNIASARESKYVIRANMQIATNDKYKKYQCKSTKEVAKEIINILEKNT